MLLLIFVISCGKNLSVDSVNQYGQLRKASVCSEADLNQNYLEQENLLKIYQCLGWNQGAPELLSYLQDFNTQSWLEAFSEINRDFFGRASKAKFFDQLLILRNSRELINLQSTFHLILGKETSYKLINKALDQFEKERTTKKNFLSYENFHGLVRLYDDLFLQVLANKKSFKEKSLYDQNEIETDLIAMLDVFSRSIERNPKRFANGISDFLIGLDESWFEANFLSDQNRLPKTIQYVKSIFPQMKSAVSRVRALLAKEVTVCRAGSDSIEVNHKIEVFEKLHSVTQKGQSEFLNELNDLVLKYGFWREVCRDDKEFLKDLNTINDTLIFVSEFVAETERFELFRNLLYALSEKDIANYDQLLEFLLSEDLEVLIDFVDKYLNQRQDFSNIVIETLGSLDISFFKTLAEKFSQIASNDESFFSYLVTLWGNLEEQEKRDFLSIILLPLYEDEQNVSLLSHFFLNLVNDYPSEVENTYKHIRDLYLDNKVYPDLITPLKDLVLFDELKAIIKENGLISLINLVLPTTKKIEHKKPEVKILAKDFERVINKKDLNCSNDIIRANLSGKSFSKMIENMPESCHNDNESFMVKIYKAIKIVNDVSLDHQALYQDNGIFSSNFLKLHTALFLSQGLDWKMNPHYKKSSLFHALKVLQDIYLEAKVENLTEPVIEEFAKAFATTNLEAREGKLRISIGETFKKRNQESLLGAFLKEQSLDLATFIELLYDFSDPKLVEKKQIKERGELIEREFTPLEMMEYSFESLKFSHNHYAAYAINKLGTGANFNRELRKLQGNLRKMRFSFSLFRRLNYVEASDRENIENLNETFDAFWLLEKQRPVYGNQTYVELIQSLLRAVINSSFDDQKNLKLLTKPQASTKERHAAEALIELMSSKTLSQLAFFLRSYIAPTKEEFFSKENLSLISFLQKNLQDDKFIKNIIEIEINEVEIKFETLEALFWGGKILSLNDEIRLSALLELVHFKEVDLGDLEKFSPFFSHYLKNLSCNEDFRVSFKRYYNIAQVKSLIDSLSKIDWHHLSPFQLRILAKKDLLKIVNAYQLALQQGTPSSVYSLIDSLMGDRKHYPLKEILLVILDSQGENLEEFLKIMKNKVTVLIQ